VLLSSTRVGWPEVKPNGEQTLAPIEVKDLAFTRAMDRQIWPRSSIVLELGARNGWYTSVLAKIVGLGGKIFSADDSWMDPKARVQVPLPGPSHFLFDVFVANRWNDREKIVPLRGTYTDAMRWIHEHKGTVDHIVISSGSSEKENTRLLRTCWSFFPKTPILGATMLVDSNVIAVRAPAGSVFRNQQTYVEWTPAK